MYAAPFQIPKMDAKVTIMDDMGHLNYYVGDTHSSSPTPNWLRKLATDLRGEYFDEFWFKGNGSEYPINRRLKPEKVSKHKVYDNGQQIDVTVNWQMDMPEPGDVRSKRPKQSITSYGTFFSP